MNLYKIVLLILGLLVLTPFSASHAIQSDACSLSTVLSSFEAAALSGEVDTWANQYENSECPSNVKRSVRLMLQSYRVFVSKDVAISVPRYYVGTGQGVSSYKGNLNVNLGFYSDVTVQFTELEGGLIKGVLGLGSFGQTNIAGHYYGDPGETPNSALWDVVEGCNESDVIAWVDWITGEVISGNILRNLLYVAEVTADGQMCAAAYDSSTGGLKVVDWRLSTSSNQ